MGGFSTRYVRAVVRGLISKIIPDGYTGNRHENIQLENSNNTAVVKKA